VSRHKQRSNQPSAPKPWKKRRAVLDAIHRDHRLTTGARAFLGLLLDRSDDAGKPVWGNQEKMAVRFGRSDRTLRRYRDELERLGYLKVYRSKPERGSDGRWCRRRSNSYYFCLPARSQASEPAPRHRQKAGYCVLGGPHHSRTARTGSSHLADIHGRSTPQEGAPTSAAPAQRNIQPLPTPEHPTERARPEFVAAALAEARATLQTIKQRPTAVPYTRLHPAHTHTPS
jgi:hypothetical protein